MSKSKSWGPWENLSSIGEGGAGHVFKVRNTNTGVIGALKRLKNANRGDRFRREETVRQLDHPGIVPLLDDNLDDDPLYAVYEFEPGGSLGDLPVEELLAIPLSQRLQLCEQICDALHAAHEASIIHRDVKPDNILISIDRKTARLCDFGLVFCDDGGERQTATMEQAGSRYYIPPEMEAGRADQVSTSSDVYSLGKLLYFVVSGTIFARERHREKQYDLAIVHGDPFLEAISQILDGAITDDLEARTSSAATMKKLIELARKNIAERRPVHGVPATYRCVFCNVGTYQEVCVSGDEGHNSGYPDEGRMHGEKMIFLECGNCGNCQRFKLKHGGKTWFPKVHEMWHTEF